MTFLGLWLGIGVVVWFGGGWPVLLVSFALLAGGAALDARRIRR